MRRSWPWWVLAVVAVLSMALLIRWRHEVALEAALRVPIAGGDGGGLPLASASDEHFDPHALADLLSDPAAAGLRALIVMRHGHVVLSHYAGGLDASSVVDTAGFARVLPALLLGAALPQRAITTVSLGTFQPARLRDSLEQATHQRYPEYLSRRLWSRLNAHPAWIRLPALHAPVPPDCCFFARVQDWMRIGGLLVNDGNFEGTQVVGRGWVARMRMPLDPGTGQGFGVWLPASAPRAVPFAAADTFFLRGPDRWRLWLVPSLQLAVLAGGPAVSGWDESALPNHVVQAVLDRPVAPPGQSALQQLVHGH